MTGNKFFWDYIYPAFSIVCEDFIINQYICDLNSKCFVSLYVILAHKTHRFHISWKSHKMNPLSWFFSQKIHLNSPQKPLVLILFSTGAYIRRQAVPNTVSLHAITTYYSKGVQLFLVSMFLLFLYGETPYLVKCS